MREGVVSKRGGGKGQGDRPNATWLLHGGGLPLTAIGGQLAAAIVLGKPRAYFDHDAVMFAECKRLNVISFPDYADALFGDRQAPFSAFVSIADLAWLSKEPAIGDRLQKAVRFARLCFRDPVLQALNLIGQSLPESELDDAGFRCIADALIELEDREETASAWLDERGKQASVLTVEDLAAPGVAALRHLFDAWSLSLPANARIFPIAPPDTAHQVMAKAFRAEAERRHWGHAARIRAPHWLRRMD